MRPFRRGRPFASLVLAVVVLTACGTPATAVPSTTAQTSTAAPPAATQPPAAAPTNVVAATQSTLAPTAPPTAVAGAASPAATTSTAAAGQGNPAKGLTAFQSVGCVACHGQGAVGNIGPKLAGTGLSLNAVISQVRKPRGQMPPFTEAQVSDATLADIYAYFQSLGPTPVPVTPTAIGAAKTPVAAIVKASADLEDAKVGSDYANDASKTTADLQKYTGQALQAAQAGKADVQEALASNPSPDVKNALDQLNSHVDNLIAATKRAQGATAVDAAKADTVTMANESRIYVLPWVAEAVRLSGETGTIQGTVTDAQNKPLEGVWVTIAGGFYHQAAVTDAGGKFSVSGVAALKAVEVKAYHAGYLYHEQHALLTKGATASVTIQMPQQAANAPAPSLTNIAVTVAPDGKSVTLSMKATQPQNRIADDQAFAFNSNLGYAITLYRQPGDVFQSTYQLPAGKSASGSWVFFVTTHECELSNVEQKDVA